MAPSTLRNDVPDEPSSLLLRALHVMRPTAFTRVPIARQVRRLMALGAGSAVLLSAAVGWSSQLAHGATPARVTFRTSPEKLAPRAHRAAKRTSAIPPNRLVPLCLRRGGLGHVKRVSSHRWQATLGQQPDTNLKLSMFAYGPYPSAGVAAMAMRALPESDLAFRGGRYIVVGRRALAYDEVESIIAVCLQAGGTGYSF